MPRTPCAIDSPGRRRTMSVSVSGSGEEVELFEMASPGSIVTTGAVPEQAWRAPTTFVLLLSSSGTDSLSAVNVATQSPRSPALRNGALKEEGVVQRRRRFTITIRPLDDLGNMLGPGLGGEIDVSSNRGRAGGVADAGDGTYKFVLTEREDIDLSRLLRFVLRDRRLEWRIRGVARVDHAPSAATAAGIRRRRAHRLAPRSVSCARAGAWPGRSRVPSEQSSLRRGAIRGSMLSGSGPI
jgi:hypothetical protein